ncbi:growth hormone-inducible transmembrane protein-like [Apostichopus japonicus]|uniref:growth hormone-inducible transmembrane protein-like n=1 Tax=Stichopus japonicus TaxID=307972 RepID=UPI003AB7282F
MAALFHARRVAFSLVQTNCHSSHYRRQFSTQIRNYANQTRLATKRMAEQKGQTLKETLSKPADGTAHVVGRSLVAGAAAAGIGALCYYGLGLSNEVGTFERAAMWPDYVRTRVRSTYQYFAMGIATTSAVAYGLSRNKMLVAKYMPKSWVGIIASTCVVLASGVVTMAVPYSEGIGLKQLTWLGHSSVIGAFLTPMCFMGGPLLIKAAWYTAGIVGGLSCIAACAPSDKFLYMGGPLAMGLGVVLISSLGGLFFPVTTALGSGLYAISTYGGVVLFSGFMLYDTQLIVAKAESHPIASPQRFDPINAAMGIYMDTINIFIRIAMILSGGGGKRK